MHTLKIGSEERGQPVSALIYLFTNMSVFLFIDKEEQKLRSFVELFHVLKSIGLKFLLKR